MTGGSLKQAKRCIPVLLFTVFFAALLAAIISGALRYRLQPSAFTEEIHVLSGFTCEIGGEEAGAVSLPHTIEKLPPRTAVTLYTETAADERESLLIKTLFAPLRLYANGELIYECGQDGGYPGFFIDPPTMIAIVPLPESDGAQHLRFEYLSPAQRDLELPEVLTGSDAALLAEMFRSNGFSLLFSLFLICVGVVMVLITVIAIRVAPAASPFLWLGLFVVATGIWVLGECDLAAFLIPYPLLLHVMSYTGLFSLTIPLLQYGRLMLSAHSTRLLRAAQWVLSAAVLYALLLQLAGIATLPKALFVFHVLIMLAYLVFAVCVILEHFYWRKKAAKRFVVPIFVLAVSAVLEIMNYQLRFTDILSMFFQIGTLFFIVSLGVIAGSYTRDAMHTVEEKIRLESQVAAMSHVLDLQRDQYMRLMQNNDAIKSMRHDMRHHLAAIGRLAGCGNAAALQAYLEELSGGFTVAQDKIYCENHVVNAIAAFYLGPAESEGIEVKTRLDIPKDTGLVPAIDLCVIMGNFLENALDACRRIEQGKASSAMNRFIHVRSLVVGDTLSIVVDNSFDGIWHERNGIYFSRKESAGTTLREGVGLSSVGAVCDKHRGLVRYERNGNIWRSSALVHMEEESGATRE